MSFQFLKRFSSNIDTSSLLFSNTDLLNLIWPLIIEQLLNITLGIADIMMVASLGEAAVSGVSLVDAVMVLVIQVFAALGTGGAVVASQYVGKKDEKLAGETAKQLLYSLIIISVFLVVLGFLSRSWILSVIFGSIEADVYAASQKYFVWTLFSLPGIALYSGCAALFRAQGNSYVSMLISVLINILNISGNAFFLFRLHWGVEGVALPTLISRLIAASVLIVLLYGAKEYHGRTAVSIKGVGHVRLNFRIIRKILYVGIPSGLENGVFQIGKILVLSIVSSYGTSAIAANAGGNTMAMLETLPGSACGLAILTVVGQCIGAGRQKEAVYFTKKITATAYVSVFIINIPILLFCSKILSFYGMSQETTRLAWLMSVSHSCFSIFIWPLAFAFPNALRAAGDTAYTMTVSILSMWILRIGFSYVFKWTGIFGLVEFMNWPASFGALCVWYAMILDWLMRSFLFVRRFSKGKWKERKLI